MIRFFASAAGFMLAAGFLAVPAQADITRSCKGHYVMDVVEIDGSPAARGNGWSFGDFSAKGSCGNTVPNRCRDRAKTRLRSCYKAHWDARWDRERPAACTADKGVSRYAMSDIKTVMEQTACCSAKARNWDMIKVDLYGVTSGDNGCGSKIVRKVFPEPNDLRTQMLVQEGYVMSCTKVRANLCP